MLGKWQLNKIVSNSEEAEQSCLPPPNSKNHAQKILFTKVLFPSHLSAHIILTPT